MRTPVTVIQPVFKLRIQKAPHVLLLLFFDKKAFIIINPSREFVIKRHPLNKRKHYSMLDARYFICFFVKYVNFTF